MSLDKLSYCHRSKILKLKITDPSVGGDKSLQVKYCKTYQTLIANLDPIKNRRAKSF